MSRWHEHGVFRCTRAGIYLYVFLCLLRAIWMETRTDIVYVCDGYTCSYETAVNDLKLTPRTIECHEVSGEEYLPSTLPRLTGDSKVEVAPSKATPGALALTSTGGVNFVIEVQKSFSKDVLTFTGILLSNNVECVVYVSHVIAPMNKNSAWQEVLRAEPSAKAQMHYVKPRVAAAVKIELKKAGNIELHNILYNCYGCDWHTVAPVVTPASSEKGLVISPGSVASFTFPSPTPIAGISLVHAPASADTESFGYEVYIEKDEGSGEGFGSGDAPAPHWEGKVTPAYMQPFPARQILYFPPVAGKNVTVKFLSNGPVVLSSLALGRTCTQGLLPNVDRIICPHYDKAWERRVHSEAQARKHHFQVDMRSNWTRDVILEKVNYISMRIWPGGVDLKLGGSVQEAVLKKYTPMWKQIDGGSITSRDLTVTSRFLGRMGSFLQQFHAWEEMYQSGAEIGLVLEDDVLITENFVAKLAKVMQNVPPDFDVVYVGGCLNKHGASHYGVRLLKTMLWRVSEHRCANGYLISRKAMKGLVAGNYPRFDPWINLDPWMEAHMKDTISEVYWVEPPISYEGSKALWGSAFESERL